ncbi:hypothetical protein [Paenibacillus lemnae]|uniref:Tyrosine protein kinase n=1 Tax=Paenibacillus lemnae TaxID=1330551 RepID=A0A848MBP3_PAELE|nr:hypothetical protein [Paenibacillus lemnae]NMO97443.1 hypothetical protein [Paenibacillus lemnae]
MSGHHHYYHHRRNGSSHRALSESLPASSYPGVEVTPYSDYPAGVETSSFYPSYAGSTQPSIAPIDAVSNLPAVSAPQTPAASSGGLAGLLGGLNLSNIDVKGIIDRMGGIDGLIANMGKVQKVMQGFQQLAPMMSIFAGALGKKKSSSSSPGQDEFQYPARRRRPAKGRKKSGTRRPNTGTRKRTKS